MGYKNRSVGIIEPVVVSAVSNTSESKWIPILKSFNPLGFIAESYAKTLVYKIETKRLEVEVTRITKQANIAHDVINKTFQLKMEELKHRRMQLITFYGNIDAELKHTRIERAEVLKMAQMSQQKAFENNLSLEEKQLHKDMTMELIKSLPNFGTKSHELLDKLVQALPPIEISPKLLGD